MERISFSYDKKVNILDGISFKIFPGEFIALIGPNGSGKTTLIKHLNGLLLPSSGKVIVDDLNTVDNMKIKEIRSRVGIVFQNPENGLIASTVEEDVAFGPENQGLSSSEVSRRVHEALAAVGLEEYSQRAPHTLSGGQKQKAALAGALASGSSYLLLDEATSMLDPKSRKDFLSLICELNKEKGLTIIMATHNMEEAALASRLIGILDGGIMLDSSPVEAFEELQLEKLGLEVPLVTLFGKKLAERGINLKLPVLTEQELVDRLCSN